MNYSIVQQGDTVQNGVISAMCDSRNNINELPTDWRPGSTCIVIEDSSVWMLGNDAQWHEFE